MRWPGPRAPVDRDTNPAASMALLEEVLDPPIGPGYHSAAERRVAAGLPSSSGTRTWLMLVVCLLLGLLASVAATTLRLPDPAAAAAREQLITRIEAAEAAGDEQREQVDVLRAEIVDLEQRAQDTTTGPGPSVDIVQAGLLAGAATVTGPGTVILLEDAPRPANAAPGEQVDRERVNARDVQLIVNALWAAGAEAISVNGHRLTSTSAIRFAGQAIVVDFRSLAPPYEIRAIGDPVALAEQTGSGFVGSYLSELRTKVGLPSTVSASERVEIPAATRLTTRFGAVVERPPEADPTPGTDPVRPTAPTTPSPPPTTAPSEETP